MTFAFGPFTDRFPNALHCTATAAPLQPWPPRTLPTFLIPFALPLPLLLHNRDYTRAGSPPLSRAKQRTRTSRMHSRAPSRARCHTTYIQRKHGNKAQRTAHHGAMHSRAPSRARLVAEPRASVGGLLSQFGESCAVHTFPSGGRNQAHTCTHVRTEANARSARAHSFTHAYAKHARRP